MKLKLLPLKILMHLLVGRQVLAWSGDLQIGIVRPQALAWSGELQIGLVGPQVLPWFK